MPANKLKSESYQNLGGINTKVSTYQIGITEFFNLKNLDFTKPASLTMRPGTTAYMSTHMAGAINGLYQFSRLDGSSYLIAASNNDLFTVQTGGFSAFGTSFIFGSSSISSFQSFVDQMFVVNGERFYRYDGTSYFFWSLPCGLGGPFGFSAGLGAGTAGNFAPVPMVGGGLSGVYYAGYGYLNVRGYYG